jgi:hypothetical protein
MGFLMSKMRKSIKPIIKKNKVLLKEKEFLNSSKQKIKTNGIAVNSSQITSGGSSLPNSISARVHKGIPKINSVENRTIIPMGGMGVNQKRKEKANSPTREPKVPGAGKRVPTGPRVDKVLIKKSIKYLLR